MARSTPTHRDERALEHTRRRRRDLGSALAALEIATTAPSRGRAREWGRRTEARIGDVGHELDRHITTTEGPGGLHAEILEETPRLSHAVEALRREHTELRACTEEVRGLAHTTATDADDAAADEARSHIFALLTAFSRHRHRGAELVYEAYNVDLSAGD